MTELLQMNAERALLGTSSVIATNGAYTPPMPQTVGMRYLARRIAACFVDYLCIVCYAALLFVFIIVVVQPEMERDDVERVAALRLQLVGLTTLTLPVVMVFAWMESSRFQATPGKLLLGLRAMSTKGKRLSLPRSFGRNALTRLKIKASGSSSRMPRS